MICFEVHRNGVRLARAGIEGFAVLNAILPWVHRTPHAARATGAARELTFSVGGLESVSKTSMSWWSGDVAVGDELRIRIEESAEVDAPSHHVRPIKADLRRKNLENRARYIAELERELKQLKAEDRKVRVQGRRKRHAAKARKRAPPKP